MCTQFAVYSAGIYSATIMAQVAGDGNTITAFGWNVVVNLFYIPGSFVGCFVSDWIGPRYCLILGLAVSAYPPPYMTIEQPAHAPLRIYSSKAQPASS
jgi:hypothetical protein